MNHQFMLLCCQEQKYYVRSCFGMVLQFAKLFINLNFSPFPVPFSPIYSPLRNAPNGHAYHKGVEVYDKGYKNTKIQIHYFILLDLKSLLELSLTSCLFELTYHIFTHNLTS